MKRLVSACIVIAAGLASCLVVAPHFSSTLQAVVVASEDPVPFGQVPVMTTSPPHAVTLSPSGTADSMETLMAITETCSDFAVQASGLPAIISQTCTGSGTGAVPPAGSGTGGCTQTTYTFTGTFSPAVAGTSSCVVTLVLASGNQTITFTGDGVAQMFAIDVQPPSINFGGVPMTSTSSPANITVSNIGSSTLSINSVTLNNSSPAAYALTQGSLLPHQIPVGGKETYSLTCTPPTASPFNGSIVFASNDPAKPMVTVTLACNGINSDIIVSPNPATFASARVGEPPPDIPVTVATTTSPRIINSITLDNGSTPELSFKNMPAFPINLGSGSMTTFNLHYTAATARPMGQIGRFTVNATGLQPQDTIVSGAALATSMSLTPAVVDLGPVCVGTAARTDIDVFANNAGSFKLISVTGLAIPFSLMNFTPNTVVVGGAHAMFTIAVSPTAPGPLSQLASVNTDIPGMPTHDLMVQAQGLPPGVAATPSPVQFGTWMVGQASSLKKVMLTNCNTAPLIVASASIDSTEFQIVNDPPIMNHSIDPRTSFEIDLLMIAQRPGSKTAHLVLETDAGEQVVELDGAANGGTEGGGKDRESYYACGSGRPASLWPIALALLALRRRRR